MLNASVSFISRSRLTLAAIVAAICLIVSAAPAWAQGTMGAVPDPISTRELEGYANRLDLSPQQRQALEPLHEQYKQEFAQLRDKEIEAFLNTTRGMQGGGMAMLFDREATKKAFRDLESINNRIKAIDNRMFDQMQSMLTEEQSTQMQFVRQARERLRFRSGLNRLTSAMNPAAQVDLSEILLDLSLTAAELESAGPVISAYESNLTNAARRLYDSTASLVLEGLEKVQQSGFNEQTPREQWGRAFQELRPIMSEIQLKLAARAAEVGDLNRRSLRSISPLLTPEHARTLLDQFYARGYPEIRSSATVAQAFDIVLKFQELSDELRPTIEAMRTEFHTALDRLMEQAMDAIDENRKTQTFFDQNRENRRAQDEKLSYIRDRRRQLNESTREALVAALTPELAARLEKRLEGGAEAEAASEAVIVAVEGAPGGGGAVSVGVRSTAAVSSTATELANQDRYVPGPISAQDADRYSQRLNLDAEQQAILNSLHADYREQYEALDRDQIAAVRQAERSLWGMNNGQVAAPTQAAVDSLYAQRQSALAAVLALDSKFFDDLSIAVMSDDDAAAVQRMRDARLRDVYGRVARMETAMTFGGRGGRGEGRGPGRGEMAARAMRMMGGGSSSEAGVDLTEIIDSISLTPTDASHFANALVEYEKASLAAYQKMYDASIRMQKASDSMMAQATTIEQGGDRTVRLSGDTRQMMEAETRAVTEARRAVAALNKATLDSLANLLSAGDAAELRATYNRKAYPDAYRDPGSAKPHLNAALSLQDLSPQQRSQVQDIAMEFNGQYEDLCAKLVELAMNAPEFGGPGQRDGGGWQAMQEQIRAREKIEFERTDLNHKTLAKLRSTLNELQVQQLGGLEIQDQG